jgi:uncharacterized membrane protein YphA (DoxX/SURF4 family)
MAKRLALTLIIAGAIGTLAWGWNVKEAKENYPRIKEVIRQEQLTEKNRIDIERDPRIMNNAMYGGGSLALALASAGAVVLGGYLQIGKKYFNLK